MNKTTPVYIYPSSYAEEHKELELFRQSMECNVACRDAIVDAIRNHYYNNTLHSKEAVTEVVKKFGYERVFYVLANTVQKKDWDGRITRDNKAWAAAYTFFEDKDYCGGDRSIRYIVDAVNPGLTDLFLTSAREAFQSAQQK